MNKIKLLILFLGLSLICFPVQQVFAGVPVRISIKFILDANGNRPANGNLNTDEEIQTEVEEATTILKSTLSEFEINQFQFVELEDVSQWYSTEATGANRDLLRTAALLQTSLYVWRGNAINIYINGGTGTAVGKFPPNNDIILMNQGCGNNPSCILHEIGHNLNLMHTHETVGDDGGDECSDTLRDDDAWNNKDQMAQAAYGANYADLNSAQQNAVDRTWHNIMSYHTAQEQRYVTACQRNRISAQADSDRHFLSKTPVYVRYPAMPLFSFGTYLFPYGTLQEALNSGDGVNGVIVLETDDYTITQSQLNFNTEIVSRAGLSRIDRGKQTYVLPTNMQNSKNAQVSAAIAEVQSQDTLSRKVMREAKALVESGAPNGNASAIMENARARQAEHKTNALNNLLRAERFATEEELAAIQLELAQRYRYSDNLPKSIEYYNKVITSTQQPGLVEECQRNIKKLQKMIEDQAKDLPEPG